MSHNENSAADVTGLKKHPIFFIEAEMVTIQVEDTLFNPFMRRIQAIGPDRIRSALQLADMWDFAHHRAYLLEMAFNTFDIVDQIVLAEQFNVRDRIQRLYLQLCQRHEPLTMEEARKLGLEGTALVGRLRERLCRRIPPPVVISRQAPPHGWAAVIAAHAAAQRLAGPEELNPLPSGEADAQFLKKEIQDWFKSGL
ncbi:hypothetical protein FRC06_009538 [Ceratobasidium sp. 370]|nr:hypothetical protein FRC06_009538 [Ceratobasidium sp. 370]